MTLNEMREKLAAWEAAESAVMRNKAYTVDGLSYTRQDLSAIHSAIDYWRRRIAATLKAVRGQSSATFRPTIMLDKWPADWTRRKF